MNTGYLSRYPRVALPVYRRVISSSMYDGWSREQLIARLTELDGRQRPPRPEKIKKDFRFSSYSKRKIALKFCYSGWEYGGLAFQNMPTALPTVEGVLYEALVKARLIDPAGGLEGCGWEKCGRTDRGVSAAGQVISLWVRSALDTQEDSNPPISTKDPPLDGSFATQNAISEPISTPTSTLPQETGFTASELAIGLEQEDFMMPSSSKSSVTRSSSGLGARYEHDYLAILNRLLPPTIRIIAWSPVSDSFSARFSCTYRHYKYFFSSETTSGTRLDIERMRAAASHLIGEHDFRNMCKLDPAKQISSFRRIITHAGIEPLEGRGLYVFDLVGSAFLYHQVRHIMAILFMVGHGQEEPSVVSSLMNVEGGLESDATEVVDSKPEYQMADALPLLLWNCGYPEGKLDWRTTNGAPTAKESEGRIELYQRLHAIHSRSQIYMTLNEQFLAAAAPLHPPPFTKSSDAIGMHTALPLTPEKLLIPLGGGTYKRTSYDKYTPLLSRNRLDPVDEVNERWRLGKGFRRNERKKAAEPLSTTADDGDE